MLYNSLGDLVPGTQYILYQGTVSSLKVLDTQYTIMAIQNSEKDPIFYMINSSTVKMSQLSVGQTVDFICDGAKILEIL